MNILGINFLSESTACIIKNGKLIFAISEERINRKKNWYGIPYKSINLAKKLVNNEIDSVVTCGYSAIDGSAPNRLAFEEQIIKVKNSNLSKKIKLKQIKFLNDRRNHEDFVISKRTIKVLNELKKKFGNLKIYDHHTSHAASAAFFSEYKSCIVLTIDGWGDDASSKIFEYKNGKLKLISKSETFNSLGYFYGSITKLFGFKPHQHEGKILGLAAYGNPRKAYKDLSKLIGYDKKNKCFVGYYEKGIYQAKFLNKNLNYLKKKYSREDICAAAQKVLEKTVIDCIQSISKKRFNIALAGGVFANVKLNQKIMQLKKIKNLFIFPNMGDGGLSVGAASLEYFKKTKKKPKKINNYYLGTSYSNKEVLREINRFKLKYYKFNNLPLEIAKRLSKGKIIAHFNERMEFGPRALGNRSILCSATKKKN